MQQDSIKVWESKGDAMKKYILLVFFFYGAQGVAQDIQQQFIHIKNMLIAAQEGTAMIAQNSVLLEDISVKIPGILSVPVASVVDQINEALKTVQAGWFRDFVAKLTNLSDLEPFLVRMATILQALVGQLQIMENELVLCAHYIDPKNKQGVFLIKDIAVIADALKEALKAFDPMIKTIDEMFSSIQSLGLL